MPGILLLMVCIMLLRSCLEIPMSEMMLITNRNDTKRRNMSPPNDSDGPMLLYISHNPPPDTTDTKPMRRIASVKKRRLGNLIIWLTNSSLAINAMIDRRIITYTVRYGLGSNFNPIQEIGRFKRLILATII